MSGDFTPEQKRYLEGFTSGLQIARAGRGLAGGRTVEKHVGPDAEHFAAADARLGQQLAHGARRAVPPVFRTLLRPAGMRLQQRIFDAMAAPDAAVNAYQNAFDRRCSQIDPQIVPHNEHLAFHSGLFVPSLFIYFTK